MFSMKNAANREDVRKVMSALGSRTSDRKRRAAAENSRRRLVVRPIESFECRCGQCPDAPKTYCNRGRAILRRRRAAARAAEAQATDTQSSGGQQPEPHSNNAAATTQPSTRASTPGET